MFQRQIRTDPEHICVKLSQKRSREYFQHIGGIFLAPKSNSFFINIEKLISVIWGNKANLVGRTVATFYDICMKTWRRSQTTESLKLGFHLPLTPAKQVV